MTSLDNCLHLSLIIDQFTLKLGSMLSSLSCRIQKLNSADLKKIPERSHVNTCNCNYNGNSNYDKSQKLPT